MCVCLADPENRALHYHCTSLYHWREWDGMATVLHLVAKYVQELAFWVIAMMMVVRSFYNCQHSIAFRTFPIWWSE